MTKPTLLSLCEGEGGRVSEITADTAMLRRFLDLGCIAGAEIFMLGKAPFGGMRAYLICGAVIAIREKDAANIHILVEK